MRRVLFTEAAEIDFTDAIGWYDNEAPEIKREIKSAKGLKPIPDNFLPPPSIPAAPD